MFKFVFNLFNLYLKCFNFLHILIIFTNIALCIFDKTVALHKEISKILVLVRSSNIKNSVFCEDSALHTKHCRILYANKCLII